MKSVRDGYKMTEIGMIPTEWNILKLSEIAEINPRREVLDDSNMVSFIAMEDITNSGRVSNKTDRLYEEVKKGYTSFKDNDVLLAKITPCFENGKRALVEKLSNGFGFGSTEFHVLRANKYSISKFLYYVISSHRFVSKAENNMTGSAGQKRVPTEFIKEYVIAVPTIEEQEKIASTLSTVDEQIDNVDALIGKNKELKKGLMQTLLTKGIGHTKFKKTEIGEIPEEWDVTTIENVVCDINQGVNTAIEKTEFIEKGIPMLKAKDINNFKVNLEQVSYIDKTIFKSYSDRYKLKFGNLLFTNIGSDLGKASIYDKDIECSYAWNVMRIDSKDIIQSKFLFYVINSDRFYKEVKKRIKGTGMGFVSKDSILSIKIQFPSAKEQNKISEILGCLDDKIDKYENKKQKLEELKKGLMQQLLTGNIRI